MHWGAHVCVCARARGGGWARGVLELDGLVTASPAALFPRFCRRRAAWLSGRYCSRQLPRRGPMAAASASRRAPARALLEQAQQALWHLHPWVAARRWRARTTRCRALGWGSRHSSTLAPCPRYVSCPCRCCRRHLWHLLALAGRRSIKHRDPGWRRSQRSSRGRSRAMPQGQPTTRSRCGVWSWTCTRPASALRPPSRSSLTADPLGTQPVVATVTCLQPQRVLFVRPPHPPTHTYTHPPHPHADARYEAGHAAAAAPPAADGAPAAAAERNRAAAGAAAAAAASGVAAPVCWWAGCGCWARVLRERWRGRRRSTRCRLPRALLSTRPEALPWTGGALLQQPSYAAATLCSTQFLCVAAVCAGPMEGAGGAGAGGGLSYEAVQRLIEDRTQHLADVRMHRRACIASGVLCRVAATGRAARASWGGVQGRCHGVCEQVHERHAVCFLAAPQQDCVELEASRGTPAGTCVLATGRKFCSKARRSPRWAALTICTQT